MAKAIKSSNPIVAAVNKNFIIRWRFQDEKKWQLISAGRYDKLLDQKLRDKHFDKVLNGENQNYAFKIRSRIEIKFVAK